MAALAGVGRHPGQDPYRQAAAPDAAAHPGTHPAPAAAELTAARLVPAGAVPAVPGAAVRLDRPRPAPAAEAQLPVVGPGVPERCASAASAAPAAVRPST